MRAPLTYNKVYLEFQRNLILNGCFAQMAKYSKQVYSGNTTITNRRQPRGTARKSRSTITRHQDEQLSKATSSLFPIEIVQQNIEQSQTPTMGVTINKKSTTTEPRPQNGQQHKPSGGLNASHWHKIFALDSAVFEVQEMFSSHGGHLTNAMYHHGETSNQINTP